jgi:hypothetical protein
MTLKSCQFKFWFGFKALLNTICLHNINFHQCMVFSLLKITLLPSISSVALEVIFMLVSFCRTIPFAWNLITAGYVEQTVHGVCMTYSFIELCYNVSFIAFPEMYLLLRGKLLNWQLYVFIGSYQHSLSSVHWQATWTSMGSQGISKVHLYC